MDLRDDLRSTLLYFDLFDYPLKEAELFRFLPRRIEFAEFKDIIHRISIPASSGMYGLRASDDLASLRQRRESRAKWMLAASKMVKEVVRRVPFIRGVYLSGSLSKGVDDGKSDIDLFLVTAESRLWISRAILTSLKKFFLFNSKKFLCPNYFVTEGHLEIPEKNIFTATELVTLRPLYNGGLLKNLLQANGWIDRFFPNYRPHVPAPAVHPSLLQKTLEFPMKDGYTAKLDIKLMNYYEGLWKRRYPQFSDEQREFLFRTTPFSSKVHPNDYQTKILETYEKRLREEGLARLTRLDD